ncbi:hypothetical protein [Methanomassiliicoccus luminyensis]|uniref:hypothetical protein n=1 Tax=Methanomassiliicoccus luminyensis TaxID=1080712 RepID=UPI0011C735D0|nr:hypothetical protein [Methanomassiliicoccus luminyensis]
MGDLIRKAWITTVRAASNNELFAVEVVENYSGVQIVTCFDGDGNTNEHFEGHYEWDPQSYFDHRTRMN